MKDLDPDHDLNSVLQLFLAPDLQRLPDALDRDFVIFGLEDGLFIHANAETFLFFLRQMRPERGGKSEIAWTDRRGRLATACLVQTEAGAERTTYLTFIETETGWQAVTATFAVVEQKGARGARPVMLQ